MIPSRRPPTVRRRRAGAACVFALLAGSSGCFSYAVVPLASVPPKEEVRVHITNDAGARLVKDLGIYTTVLDGAFDAHGDSVSVTVPIVREYRGQVLEGANQALYLGRSEVLEIRQRKFSRSRTILASVGATALFVGLVQSIIAIADPNPDTDGPPPPPPPGNRIPRRSPFVIRFTLP
jgi:hypothetical protein